MLQIKKNSSKFDLDRDLILNFKKTLLFVFVSIFILSCSTARKQEKYSTNPTLESHIDSLINPLVANSELKGCVVGIALKGKIIFMKPYGFSDLSNQTLLKQDAIFPIASVTKTFTAAAIMQLVERKKLTLDADIRNYIDFNSKGSKITVRQLLNHTSGLKDYTETNIIERLSTTGFSNVELKKQIELQKFDFNPGENLDYNNSGYFLLAMIIEKVTGISYQEYLQKYLFEAAEMNQSKNCFAMSNKDITEGFNLKNDKLVVGSTQIDYRFALGAGSICSNVNDLLKWQIRFHYQKKILSNSGYNEMVKRTKLKDGGETNYGLGLEIDQYNGNTVISHNGVIDGYLSDTRYFPSKELSIVILSNTLGRAKPSKISNQISKYFLTPKVITKPFTGNAASFIGIYEGKVMGNASRISVTSNSGVVSIESRGNKSVLQYLGNETFIAEDDYTYFFKNDILQVNGPKLSIIFRKIK